MNQVDFAIVRLATTLIEARYVRTITDTVRKFELNEHRLLVTPTIPSTFDILLAPDASNCNSGLPVSTRKMKCTSLTGMNILFLALANTR